MRKAGGESVPQQMRPVFEAIVALTDPFCHEYLNAEYAELCRRLAAALSRKRPSPLVSGNFQTWACATVYALGSVNFLFDPSQTPHLTGAQLAAAFGIAKSTAANKAKTVRDLMKMSQLDWHWSLPSRLDHHPSAWLIQVNGLIVDARHVPRDVQEEAFRRGYIPYVPSQQQD